MPCFCRPGENKFIGLKLMARIGGWVCPSNSGVGVQGGGGNSVLTRSLLSGCYRVFNK